MLYKKSFWLILATSFILQGCMGDSDKDPNPEDTPETGVNGDTGTIEEPEHPDDSNEDETVLDDTEENDQNPTTTTTPDDIVVNGDCEISTEEQEMLDAVNAMREQTQTCGESTYEAVEPLAWSCQLRDAAIRHSEDMAQNSHFDHTGTDGTQPGARIDATGYQWQSYGENIAAGVPDVDSAMSLWMSSPGHCANIMGSGFTEFGSSVVSNDGSKHSIYWTQVFGNSWK